MSRQIVIGSTSSNGSKGPIEKYHNEHTIFETTPNFSMDSSTNLSLNGTFTLNNMYINGTISNARDAVSKEYMETYVADNTTNIDTGNINFSGNADIAIASNIGNVDVTVPGQLGYSVNEADEISFFIRLKGQWFKIAGNHNLESKNKVTIKEC